MATSTIRLPDDKHLRLKKLSESKGFGSPKKERTHTEVKNRCNDE